MPGSLDSEPDLRPFVADGRIVTIHNYLNTEILAEFGLPPRLDA